MYAKKDIEILRIYGHTNEKIASFELKIDGTTILLPYSTLKDI